MKKKVNDRVVVNSKYFNMFNGLEGVIQSIDEHYEQFTVKIDGVDNLQSFDSKELKLIKPIQTPNSRSEDQEKTVRHRTAEIAYKDFHELWAKAKENDNYNDRAWKCMFGALCQLIEYKPFKL